MRVGLRFINVYSARQQGNSPVDRDDAKKKRWKTKHKSVAKSEEEVHTDAEDHQIKLLESVARFTNLQCTPLSRSDYPKRLALLPRSPPTPKIDFAQCTLRRPAHEIREMPRHVARGLTAGKGAHRRSRRGAISRVHAGQYGTYEQRMGNRKKTNHQSAHSPLGGFNFNTSTLAGLTPRSLP